MIIKPEYVKWPFWLASLTARFARPFIIIYFKGKSNTPVAMLPALSTGNDFPKFLIICKLFK